MQNSTLDKVEYSKVSCNEDEGSYAQYASNFMRTVYTTEKTKESCSSIRNTFHYVAEKRVPYNLKIVAGVAFLFAVQYIISIKDSEGSILVSAHASTVYAL
jgi:hypothetical protein